MVFANRRATAKTGPQNVNPGLVQELPPSSAQVAAQLEDAHEKAEQALQALDAARTEYRDAPSLELKHAEMAAEVARDVAVKTVERLERELTAARERETEAERQKGYDAAAARARAIPDRLKRWDDLCGQLAALAAEIRDDTQVIEAANRALPQGAERLRTLEDHRVRPSRTETVKTRHQGWIVAATREPYHGAVSTNADGQPSVRGIIRGEWEEQEERFTPASTPDRLLDTLVLPSVAGGKHWPRTV